MNLISEKNANEHLERTQQLRDSAVFRIRLGYTLLVLSVGILLIPDPPLRGSWEAGVYAFTQFGLISIGWRLVYFNNLNLRYTYQRFCSRKLLPEATRLRYQHPKLRTWIPKRKVFRKAKDLRDLEQRMLWSLNYELRKLQQEDKLRRWATRNEKLWLEFEAELRGYHLSDELIEKFRKGWSQLSPNPEKRKRYAQNVTSLLGRKRMELQTSKPATVRQTVTTISTTEPDILDLYEAQAAAATSPESIRLRELAQLEQDRRTKIRLYKQAIWADKPDEEAEESVTAPIESTQASASPEVRILDLSQLLEQQLHLQGLMPNHIDMVMVKQILLVLASPGRRFRIWGTQTRLVRRVRQRYEIEAGRPFDPVEFRTALIWMLRVGIVASEPAKGSETVYHIPRNARDAQTENAREVIRVVARLREELARGKVW